MWLVFYLSLPYLNLNKMAFIDNPIIEGKPLYIFKGREILICEDYSLPKSDILSGIEKEMIGDIFEDNTTSLIGVYLNDNCPTPDGCKFVRLPEYFIHHDKEEITRCSRIKGYASWRENMKFCPKCGSSLELHKEENAKVCPSCGTLHFPRIEPCIITLVKKGDEILLLRNIKDTKGIYACLAGFIELGETVEQAVAREVMEEASIEVQNIQYVGSQSWPFPDQLMMAFYAEYKSGEIKIQPTEIADAKWFSRDNLPPLPPKGSIARKLIDGEF